MDSARLRLYAGLDQRRLTLQREIKEIEGQLRPLEEAILEEMAQEGVPQAKVDVPGMGLVTVHLQRLIWARCVDEDWERACEALKDAGLGEFVQRRYNTTSFSAYLRELDRAGEPLPEALIGAIDMEARLSVRTRRS